MGQTPFNAQNAVISTNGGQFSALALAAGANLVKSGPGRLVRLSVVTVGTAGTFAAYDAATTASAGATNIIYSAVNTTAAGTVVTLEFPVSTGIVVTVPTGGSVSVSYI